MNFLKIQDMNVHSFFLTRFYSQNSYVKQKVVKCYRTASIDYTVLIPHSRITCQLTSYYLSLKIQVYHEKKDS